MVFSLRWATTVGQRPKTFLYLSSTCPVFFGGGVGTILFSIIKFDFDKTQAFFICCNDQEFSHRKLLLFLLDTSQKSSKLAAPLQ